MSDKPFPWRTLLFASLAANLLLVGGLAGAYAAGVRVQRETTQAIVDRMPGPRAFMAALPPETRIKMRRELVRSWDETRDARRAATLARRAAFDAAAQEPYDAARVRAAFAQLREADQAAIGVFHDNVIAGFATLTPEERQQALQALRRATPGRRAAVAPAELNEEGSAAPVEDRATRRERLRERMRERRRERRENAAP